MDKETLYKTIKDRNAYLLFNNLHVDFSYANLNGANTHRAKNLLGVLKSHANLYKNKDFPQEETIAEYRIRDKQLFENSINTILEVVNNYGMKI
jgi:uncharacterized protein YjbI with pentapeptide repeats